MERKAQEKVAKMFDEKAQEYEDVLGTFEADFFESLEREAEAVGDEKPNNGRDGARGGAIGPWGGGPWGGRAQKSAGPEGRGRAVSDAGSG